MPVTLQGAEELRRNLQAMTDDLRRETLELAALDGAVPITETAQELAPELQTPHAHRVAGALKLSIESRLKPRKSPDVAVVAIGPVKEAGDADPFYATWEEYGTRRAPAHPFLRPALLTRGAEATQRVWTALWNAITKYAR